MSVAAVQTEILQPMQQLYLPPRQMDEAAQQAALRGYAMVLANFPTPALKAAWIEVVAAHTGRGWPVPGVIVLAARKALKEHGVANDEHREPYPWEPQNITLNRLQWERVRGTQMARDAVRAECSWSLKCRVLNDGKKPEQIDLRELIAEHQSAARAAESLDNGEAVYDRYRNKHVTFDGPNRVTARKMWRTLLVREAETAEEIRRAGTAA